MINLENAVYINCSKSEIKNFRGLQSVVQHDPSCNVLAVAKYSGYYIFLWDDNVTRDRCYYYNLIFQEANPGGSWYFDDDYESFYAGKMNDYWFWDDYFESIDYNVLREGDTWIKPAIELMKVRCRKGFQLNNTELPSLNEL